MAGSNPPEGCIALGPWGGSKGADWVYMPQVFPKKIKISVRHAGVVDFINFQTYFITGETLISSFGGKGGNQTDTICLDYPNEYLESISGTLGNYEGSNVVMSICFTTNHNRYGPYGNSSSGTAFSCDSKGGMIVGFHGRADKYVNAIGVYMMPLSLALSSCSTSEGELLPEDLCSSMSRVVMPRDAGPWGADGGKPWDDGFFSTIKKVHVHLGNTNVIYALQFEYLKWDGKTILSQIHGGNDGSKIEMVSFDVEDEYLTGITGFYGPVEGYKGLEAIVSITFRTNVRMYGPYGEERGVGYTYFSSTASPGKVVGFHGRDNGFVSKIGVHMEYF